MISNKNSNIIKISNVTCTDISNDHIGLRLLLSSFPSMKLLKNEEVNDVWNINKVVSLKSQLTLKLWATRTQECSSEDLENLGQVQIKTGSTPSCIPFDKEPNCNVCLDQDLGGLTLDTDNIFSSN